MEYYQKLKINLGPWAHLLCRVHQCYVCVSIAHDRSKEFHWKFNRPVATKMIQLQNPLLRFHKTTKGNFSGEDFQISPTVSFLDYCDSLAQIMPYLCDAFHFFCFSASVSSACLLSHYKVWRKK